MTITEDAITMVNTNGQGPTIMSYKVVGGNARLVVIDVTTIDGDNFHINIRLVDGGIAMETVDCQSNPEVCEREKERERKRHEGDTNTFSIGGLGASEPQPSQTRPQPTQPQWIYFRPFPATETTSE